MRHILLYFTFVLLCTGCFSLSSKSSSASSISVGVPADWGELIPSLQHTAYADAILSNSFESLVRVGGGGVIEPLAAKSWTVDKNYTTFTFTINTDKKFANGKKLTASDFKNSWESALLLSPKSSNSSLQDVLYQVVGFEDFQKSKTLKGIETPNDETLIVRFQKPFRTALVYLSGSRMAAFIKEGDHYLGTGPYRLASQSKGQAEFVKNKFSDLQGDFDKVVYVVVPTSEAVVALNSNKIQLYTFSEKTQIDECLSENTTISCYLGSASRHFTIILNGKKGRLLANTNHRKAFQALVAESLLKYDLPPHLKQTLVVDPQLFLPLQKGQISAEEAQKIIFEGKPFIAAFIKATQKQPLTVKTSTTEEWLIGYVKNLGVTVSDSSKAEESKNIVDLYYKTYDVDLLAMGIGVVNGDPDGIYHALGRDGSISSPMSYRKPLADLLETGRTILDDEKIAPHYQDVTKAALREVPFVHLGFLKTKIAYRNDLLKVKSQFKHREDDRLITFSPL